MRLVDPRLLRRARAVRVALGLDVAAGVVRTALLLVQVALIAHVIAGLVDDGTRPATPALVTLTAVVAARSALAIVVERVGRHAAVATQSALRRELVDRALRPGDGLLIADVPAIAVAAVQGVDGLGVYFGRYLPQAVLAGIVPVVVLVWTATVDIASALIMLVTLPLIPLFGWLIGRSTGDRARENHRALVQLSTHFLDLVRGLPTLRAFNRGSAQAPLLAESAERYRRTTMRTLRLAFLSGTVLDLVTTFSIALVAVTLGVRLVGGSVSLVAALTVLLLVPEMYAPMRQVTALFHASADGLAAADGILGVLDAPGSDAAAETPIAEVGAVMVPPDDDPDLVVRIRGVTVRFPGRPVPALDGVDLAVHRGEVVAVVGPSGAGKTTLGRVVLGLVVPTVGAVTSGGRAIRDDLDNWRERVAWAAQRPALLHATVAQNIALGLPDTPRADVVAAAISAGAHEFVTALPAGYDTVIGDGGRGLSAGQRQRLGLARALVRTAELVVLDEPTAHLDEVTARTAIDAIRAHSADRAVLMLTHDPALAAIADRTVRLAAGQVVPAGALVGERPA